MNLRVVLAITLLLVTPHPAAGKDEGLERAFDEALLMVWLMRVGQITEFFREAGPCDDPKADRFGFRGKLASGQGEFSGWLCTTGKDGHMHIYKGAST